MPPKRKSAASKAKAIAKRRELENYIAPELHLSQQRESGKAAMDADEEPDPLGGTDEHPVFLPMESVDESGLTVTVKEEIMIEDVVGNFHASGSWEFETGETEDIEEEMDGDEISDDFETKFPFVKCEYTAEEDDENPSQLRVEGKTPLRVYGRRSKSVNHPETDPLSLTEVVTTEERFLCEECGKIFKTKQNLGFHQITCYLQLEPLSCKRCGKTFSEIQVLQSHVKQCLEKTRLRCLRCDEHFQSKEEINSHYRTVHRGDRTYRCSLCKKWFSQHRYLKQHQAHCHPQLLPYRCQQCARSYTTQTRYIKHRQTVHPGEPCNIPADSCSSSSKSTVISSEDQKEEGNPELNKSIPENPLCDPILEEFMNKRRFICNFCGILCATQADLKVHKLSHRNELTPFSCHKCIMSFSDKSELLMHQRVHHGNQPFKCQKCVMTFSEKSELLMHQRVHRGNQPFKCHKCVKRFMTPELLFAHLGEDHAEDIPFRCTKCGECFTLVSDLANHQQTHAEMVTDLRCSVCGVMHNTYSRLIVHEGTHAVKKPHSCPECGQSFIHLSTLNYHKSNCGKTHVEKTKTKILPCGICGKRFLNLVAHEHWHRIVEAEKNSGKDPLEKSQSSKPREEDQEDSTNPEKDQEIPTVKIETIEIDPDLNESKQPEEKKKDSTPTFTFIDCGESYPKLEDFVNTINESENLSEPNSEETNRNEPMLFPCLQCGQAFESIGILKKHKRNHSKAFKESFKRFECKDCGKKFHRKSNFEVHKTKACTAVLPVFKESYKRFKCEDCGKKFHRKSNFELHKTKACTAVLPDHLKRPIFPCRICHQIFFSKFNLFQHETMIHMQKNNKCNHCGQSYSDTHCCSMLTPIVCSENIMIQGVPKMKRENEKDILTVVGKALGLEVDFDTVMTVHRIPKRNADMHPAIVARFKNRELRDLWLQKYQEKKFLLASDINTEFPHTRITVEEHMTFFPTRS